MFRLKLFPFPIVVLRYNNNPHSILIGSQSALNKNILHHNTVSSNEKQFCSNER